MVFSFLYLISFSRFNITNLYSLFKISYINDLLKLTSALNENINKRSVTTIISFNLYKKKKECTHLFKSILIIIKKCLENNFEKFLNISMKYFLQL